MIIDRFIKYMDFKGLNDNQVTMDCHLSVGLIGKARKGKSDLGRNSIEKILKAYPDLSRAWLLTGEGEMLKSSLNERQSPASADTVTIPAAVWQLIQQQIADNKKRTEQMDRLIAQLEQWSSRYDRMSEMIRNNAQL